MRAEHFQEKSRCQRLFCLAGGVILFCSLGNVLYRTATIATANGVRSEKDKFRIRAQKVIATETTTNRSEVDHHDLKAPLSSSSRTSYTEKFLTEIESQERVPCGYKKCFFPSKVNSTIGYLIAPATRHGASPSQVLEAMQVSYNFALDLEEKYQIHHFLLSNTTNLTISKDLSARLNRNLWNEDFDKMYNEKGQKRFPEGSLAFIQKVRTAPEPHLLLGCLPAKLVNFKKHMKSFLETIKETHSFARRFSENLELTRKLLQKEPCLVQGFQIFLDQSGSFYHLDFDRCFVPQDLGKKRKVSKKKIADCFSGLDKIEAKVLQTLDVTAKDMN